MDDFKKRYTADGRGNDCNWIGKNKTKEKALLRRIARKELKNEKNQEDS